MIAKKHIYTLSEDLFNNGLHRVVKYLVRRKKYGLNIKEIIYAIIETVKIKMTKSI